MELGRTFGVFVSGCLVYTVMAACSSNGTMSSNGGHASSAGGHGGTMAMGGNGGVATGGHGGAPSDSGIFDVLTDPVPDAMAMPGTRLKGKFLLGDDGSKEYQYVLEPPSQFNSLVTGPHQLWYDSMRQEDCTFRVAGDGKQRCLPTDFVEWTGGPFDGGDYADPQCTIGITQVYVPPVTCNFTPPKYVIETLAGGSCPTDVATKRVFLMGQPAPSVGNGSPLYRMQNGSCTLVGSNQVNATWYKVGAEVPPTSFVAATAGIDP